MIAIDDRQGSADLAGHLRHWGVPCVVMRLPFGDAMFLGNGPEGEIQIGIEIKAVRDAVNCMTDGRFAGHQLPGLVKEYQEIWLIIEGLFGAQFATGLLTTGGGTEGGAGKRRSVLNLGQRRFMYRDLSNWITTLETCAGVHARRTSDRVETAQLISSLHGWWEKPWSDHKSHLAFHRQRPDRQALLVRPSLTRRIAAELPGIGWEKSKAIVAEMPTVHRMVNASIDEWMTVEGIGKTIAERVHAALRSR